MSIIKNQMISALVALLIVCALLAGIYAGAMRISDTPQEALQSATLYPRDFRPLADFQLIDQHGEPFDRQRLQGRWHMLFFGFTYCPDVCPMTLQILKNAHDRLEPEVADDLQVVLVSVDPERDTPERLQKYISHFDKNFIGISGEHEQLKALTGSLGVFYSRSENPQNPEHYLVDHSASLFLLNPEGKIRALFSSPLKAELIAQDFATIHHHED